MPLYSLGILGSLGSLMFTSETEVSEAPFLSVFYHIFAKFCSKKCLKAPHFNV